MKKVVALILSVCFALTLLVPTRVEAYTQTETTTILKNLSTLRKAVKSKGTKIKDGYVWMKYEASKDNDISKDVVTAIYYSTKTKKFKFQYSKGNVVCSMTIEAEKVKKYATIYTSYMSSKIYKGMTSYKKASLKKTTNLTFKNASTSVAYKSSSIIKKMNSGTQKALAAWESLLSTKKLSMKKIGFTKYVK